MLWTISVVGADIHPWPRVIGGENAAAISFVLRNGIPQLGASISRHVLRLRNSKHKVNILSRVLVLLDVPNRGAMKTSTSFVIL
jgi:hypothetical protein